MTFIKKYHTLPLCILSANLDYPNEKTCCDKNVIHVSGWVAKKRELSSEISIKIKVDAGSGSEIFHDVKFTIERGDVIEKILHGDSINNNKPGFSTIIPFTEQCKIYIVVGEKDFLWCEISHFNFPNLTKWLESHSEFDCDLSQAEKSYLIDTCVLSYDFSKVQDFFLLDKTEIQVFYGFIERVLRWDFVLELSQYKEQGYIRSCFNNSKATIIGSVSSGNLNVLKVYDGKRVFYIFQNASSCDGIYLPECNKLFCFSHLTVNEFRAFINVIDFFPHISRPSEFAGFLTFFNRPYHYMYDMLLGYFYAYSHGYLSKNDITVSRPGSDFLNFSKMFHLDVETKVLSDLNEAEGWFYLRLGINFGNGANNYKIKNHIKALDSYIVNNLSVDEENDFLNGDFYTIWFGITSQKRSWLEQVEAITYIINNIEIGKSALRVVLDGWTSPHTRSCVDEREINSDMQLVSQIVSGVTRNVEFINVVGETIEAKIAIAKNIDFFVANYSTGSLNVARICSKVGIGHISNAFINGASGQHIHHQTILIDSEDVEDIPSPKGIDHFSYSIKKETVFNLVQDYVKA